MAPPPPAPYPPPPTPPKSPPPPPPPPSQPPRPITQPKSTALQGRHSAQHEGEGSMHALLSAAQSGDVIKFQSALKDAANVNVSDERGYTPIHWACYFNEVQIIQAAIEAGANMLAQSSKGMTPLHVAASQGSDEALQQLLLSSNSASSPAPTSDPSPLATNAATDLAPTVDHVNHWGESALHMAAGANHTSAVQCLIDAGADLGLEDKFGRSATMVAMEHGHVDLASILAAAANTDLPAGLDDSVQGSSVQVDQSNLSQLRDEFMRHVATHSRAPDAEHAQPAPDDRVGVEDGRFDGGRAGQDGGSASEKPGEGRVRMAMNKGQWLALSKQIEYPGNPVQVDALMRDPKTDIAGKDAFGWTALHKFASWDRADLLSKLLPHLTTPQVNANDNPDKETALHSAISMGAAHAVDRLLADVRVDCTIVDVHGNTPLAAARAVGATGMAAAIASRGGDSGGEES